MEYPMELKFQYPEKLSRLSTFFRIILAIPHFVVLYFINIAAGVILFLSWWAILFTGRYPKSFYDFVAWYTQWNMRVTVYLNLMTDKYPPFSGEPSTLPPQSQPNPT
ncbi:MAG: hypothetical protein A2Z29_07495 [Chloroflexi bacterium RBG_16_56_11]|nr:MAG: hypothetical protein A2Z29_07495 [Chloroflexi bacterium RBG_16_56_11]